MPRNDQIIRQHYRLRALESPRGKTLQELTRAIPADYTRHARTARRDLEALEASGVPLITVHVQEQTRWRFMDGYRNPRLLNAPAHTGAVTPDVTMQQTAGRMEEGQLFENTLEIRPREKVPALT
jgi:predicted DNA-binding transcriptional regulator YafY